MFVCLAVAWRLQTTVRSVSQRSDFALSGQWDVVTVSRDGQEETHVFDAVLVCSGHYTHPAFPLSQFPGLCPQITVSLPVSGRQVTEWSRYMSELFWV